MSLDPNFLTAVLLMNSFKHKPMVMVQAALIHLALKGKDFTAADLPAEVTLGSIHIAGLAVGSLLKQELIICVDRKRSPDPKAHGREIRVLRLGPSKRSTAITWLKRNDLPAPEEIEQTTLALS